MQKIETDIIVVGAGIAGLFTTALLQAQGYQVILLEQNTLGGVQTLHSQGILHSGLKYALDGNIGADAKILSSAPKIWQQCLQGTGILDLTAVKLLTAGQVLFSSVPLVGALNAMLASKAMRALAVPLNISECPQMLQNHAKISGRVYQLPEPVVDVASLLEAFAHIIGNNIIKIDKNSLEIIESLGQITQLKVKIKGMAVNLTANKYIFTVGQGYTNLKLSIQEHNKVQLRPLQMGLVQHPQLQPLYAHNIGLAKAPRLTITSHYTQKGELVWYVGGKVAEDGASQTKSQFIANLQKELGAAFNLDWTPANLNAISIDRAEYFQVNGTKPATFSIINQHNYIVAWPTKLVLAPSMAQQIVQMCQLLPKISSSLALSNLPKPAIAKPCWSNL